jgi:hypothetical protein
MLQQKETRFGSTQRIPERLDEIENSQPLVCPKCNGELFSIREIVRLVKIVTSVGSSVVIPLEIYWCETCQAPMPGNFFGYQPVIQYGTVIKSPNASKIIL